MALVIDMRTKAGDKIGDRRVRAISPLAADKIYELVCEGLAARARARARSFRPVPARGKSSSASTQISSIAKSQTLGAGVKKKQRAKKVDRSGG